MVDDKTLAEEMNLVQKELDDMVAAQEKAKEKEGTGEAKKKDSKELADEQKKLVDVKERLYRMRAQIAASGASSVFNGLFQNAEAKYLALTATVPQAGGTEDPSNPSYVVAPPQATPAPSAATATADKVEEPAPMNDIHEDDSKKSRKSASSPAEHSTMHSAHTTTTKK
jgi:hypothetical protein